MTRRIAFVGNPNVGKSTIFNTLTGLHQHTGNWSGVTVSCTRGRFLAGDHDFLALDLPGVYSFDVRSGEEAVTRDYVETQAYEYLLLICDCTCLERGLHLLKQTCDLISGRDESKMPQVILCANLCDEAARKGIHIDFKALEKTLRIPVVACCGREKKGLTQLLGVLSQAEEASGHPGATPSDSGLGCVPSDSPSEHPSSGSCFECPSGSGCPSFAACALQAGWQKLPAPFSPQKLAARTVTYSRKDYRRREERLDAALTGPYSGLVMCLLLFFIFWLTITGANYPSSLLWDALFRLETVLAAASAAAGAPEWFIGAFIYGVYRVVAWIVSVMLPPMAIFFPLFTFLEDLGYLPRIAFNMDGAFKKCHACGKQCLTMAMGLGCNAAGVVGCRIIDSPREHLIAILTNSLVPCNGRFPLLLTMISLFFVAGNPGGMGIGHPGTDGAMNIGTDVQTGMATSLLASVIPGFVTALALTGFILAGILATLGASWLLSHTLLKGVPSSFTLELPPYRIPQAGRVIVRSVLDRTLFVLGRAVVVAAPAGLFIWLMANVPVGETNLLLLLSGFLEPLGRLMGLDGIILMAFILGFPANEIVLPIILMAYLQSGVLLPMEDDFALKALLAAHGWTLKTAVCMAAFSLFHWPCSTTLLTIKKETGSLRWTATAFLLPTVIGIVVCILISSVWSLF